VFDESDEQNKISSLLEIGHHIETGANAFLYAEYKYISVFIIIISIVIFCTVETQWG
jgi:Na+/H+-translocating membrane pyrophosphatase